MGADGTRLLGRIDDPRTPESLKGLAEIEVLRRTWEQQYAAGEEGIGGKRRARAPKEMPEAAHRIESPYEPEARYATKKQPETKWVGYKVHLTESCHEGLPNLITNVSTTVATATDVKQLGPIQEGLERSGLLPAKQLADAAYVSVSNLLRSHALRIDLVGPPYQDTSWQAKAKEGFDKASFWVDWQKKTVICARGRESSKWCETTARARGQSVIVVEFPRSECAPCPSRSSCTRAKNLPRTLTLQPKEEHEAIRSARKRQQTAEFASTYSHRAGIEGTISQGVRAFGLRKARYRGLKRTNLQELGTAAAVNVSRLSEWLQGIPPPPPPEGPDS